MKGYAKVKKGELADTDCYMRLNRVVQLHESGEWYGSIYHRSNAPFGETLHWTRPLDALLIAGAWIASPLFGFKNGLFWWGVLISPFLLAASVLFLPWAFRPLLGTSTSNIVSILFLFQVGVLSQFYIGRPDHHSLLGFTFIISTGLILRIILDPFNKPICYIYGMMGAISMWLHVESIMLIFLSFFLLGLFWIFDDEGNFEHKNLQYSLALFIFTGAVLFLERPWHDLIRIEYDKVSIVHLFIFGLICLFWIVISYFNKLQQLFHEQRRVQRFTIASFGAVIVLLFVLLVFPGFYRGGYADIDPRILPIWLNGVEEVQSPLHRDFLTPLIQILGSAILGIIYIVVLIWKKHNEKLKGWVFMLAGILLFASACMFERRLIAYGHIMTIVPLAALLDSVLRWESTYPIRLHFLKLIRPLFRPLTIAVFCAGFLLIGYICQNMMGKEPSATGKDIVPLAQMCNELNKLDTKQARPPRILAFIDYGPEILYRTRYEVVGTPYHRNAQGILDTFKIMTAKSYDEAHELIRKRGIEMILISNSPGERNFNSGISKQSTFYERLSTEESVDWLSEIKLPQYLSFTYRLFQVK